MILSIWWHADSYRSIFLTIRIKKCLLIEPVFGNLGPCSLALGQDIPVPVQAGGRPRESTGHACDCDWFLWLHHVDDV